MISGYFEKVTSTESLLVTSENDFVITSGGDIILLGASPFTDLTGSVTAENIFSGNIEPFDQINQHLSISPMNSILSGGTSGKVR